MTTQTDKNQAPVHFYKIGPVSATIWENVTEDGKSYYHTTIGRTYQDQDGNWKSSSRFSAHELLNVAKVAERAEAFIATLD
ncbi:MAG: hypothetical protein AAF702_11875 [Chloroflexota bacterium]